ncbi:MAG: endonuclease [Rhodospirillaceae bacterium]|nr:endonuclease [Rhodospirillaceae bacterium]MBT6118692.1 endonuclease [Rhodospirillaceae bacterium]
MRLATFNLENLDDRPGHGLPLAARIEALRPVLLRLDADILCLQEVNAQGRKHHERRFDALDALLAETPYADYERATTESPSGHGGYDVHNLVILGRFPLRGRRQLRHELVEAPRYRPATADPRPKEAEPLEWDRPILWAEFALPSGAPLHVLNLHLRAPRPQPVPGQREGRAWRSVEGWAEGLFMASVKRAGQALEARRLVDTIFDADPAARLAVCGDFNADGRELPLRIVMGPDEGDEAAFSDALLARRLHALERAVPAEARYSVLHAGRPTMLDHVLVSAALKRAHLGSEIDNADLPDEVTALDIERVAGSFHAPVAVEFDLGA